jgi:beta-glucanase (GH16 family)
MPVLTVSRLYLYLALLASPVFISGHSWIENLEGPYGKGTSRFGMPTKDDSVLIRYFCPYEDLDACQPDPKHGIDLYDLPPANGDPRKPCRPNLTNNQKTPTKPGTDLLISWAGNGHVNNGQSDGTCVKVMLTPFKDDPSYDEFIQIPGAECLNFWTVSNKGTDEPEGTITIPEDLAPGQYTLFWVWNFTEFWYSSCADIEVLPEGDGTRVPTKSPVFEGPDQEEFQEVIEDYMDNGCGELQDPNVFCEKYSGYGTGSYCENEIKDECGRSSCKGLDRSLLNPCPECPPPPGCPAPKAFYDDFSNGFDHNKWLKAHTSWGSKKDGSFTNGGVVYDNVDFDQDAEKVILKAHGSLYTGDIMGVKKENGKITRANTGVRTGAAIATRDYFGAGSYEVRMKVAEELGVCSAIWTFYYNEDDYYYGVPIVNHEIDIELPGRPGAAHTDIGFDKALMNTWVGEIDSLHSVNYTQLDSDMNDGQFHTWRFDWHTDESDRRVDFYLDDKHFSTNREHVPFYASRLWIGVWFPNRWAGEANFDNSQMEIDYVKFTPFEDEIYECPEESYPYFGWAPYTGFMGEEPLFSDPKDSPVRCKTSTSPTAAPVQAPVPSPVPPPVNAPAGDSPDSYLLYLDDGCQDLPSTFCANEVSGSYCKDWSADACGRSICQGHSFSLLNSCSPPPLPTNSPTATPVLPPVSALVGDSPSDETLYKTGGCADLENRDTFCTGHVGGGSYCKYWGKDHCNRAICQGDDHSSLDAC